MSHPSYTKVAIATCFGAFLEWYDFLTFATLAVALGSLFFPSTDPRSTLLASLATFGAGMIVRPIGSAIFGLMADSIGRKPVFIITIGLMGLATLSVGLLPTYEQIGILAPIMLVVLRLIQGFSAGGEIGGNAIYLTEHAGKINRGFKTSFLQLMGPLGILASTLQLAFIQKCLSPEQFLTWGWRIPFLTSFPLLIIAFFFRRSLTETPIFIEISKKKMGPQPLLLNNFKDPDIRKKMFLLFFCISSGGAILFFCCQVYTAIFLKTIIHIDSLTSNYFMIVSTLALLPLTVFSGWLSDKIGRKKVIVSGLLSGALLLMPAYYTIEKIGYHSSINSNFITAIILIGLSFILALVVGPQTALLAELFPAKSRNTASAVPHNIAAGWIGGLLPLMVTWINQIYSNNFVGLLYPSLYLAMAGIAAILFLPETYKNNLA